MARRARGRVRGRGVFFFGRGSVQRDGARDGRQARRDAAARRAALRRGRQRGRRPQASSSNWRRRLGLRRLGGVGSRSTAASMEPASGPFRHCLCRKGKYGVCTWRSLWNAERGRASALIMRNSTPCGPWTLLQGLHRVVAVRAPARKHDDDRSWDWRKPRAASHLAFSASVNARVRLLPLPGALTILTPPLRTRPRRPRGGAPPPPRRLDARPCSPPDRRRPARRRRARSRPGRRCVPVASATAATRCSRR